MKTLLLTLAFGILAFTDASYAADHVKPYALPTCFISGEKLGEMGDPVVFVYQGQEIKLCCKNCQKKFDKDPATYLKQYQSAAAAGSSATQ